MAVFLPEMGPVSRVAPNGVRSYATSQRLDLHHPPRLVVLAHLALIFKQFRIVHNHLEPEAAFNPCIRPHMPKLYPRRLSHQERSQVQMTERRRVVSPRPTLPILHLGRSPNMPSFFYLHPTDALFSRQLPEFEYRACHPALTTMVAPAPCHRS